MPDKQKNPAPLDDLRQRLKDLGYLQSGVDRFVLAPARQARSPARIAAGASIRIGVLAAALLGPAGAIGIAARLPQLVTGVRDAIVLALYLSLLFGAGSAVAAFAVALLARAVARSGAGPDGISSRRARLTAAITGGLLSAACLGYLALWWSAVNPDPAWRAPVWTAAALAVALAISFLLGHAVAVMTGALVARESPARATEAASRRGRLAFGVRAAAFAGAAALLVATARPGDEAHGSAARPEFAVVPTGQRVVVVGVDGCDIDCFSAAKSDAGGFALESAADLPSAQDSDPARVWTTIATGVPPARHGISALELRRVAGLGGAVVPGESRSASAISAATDLVRLTRPAIASGFERRVKTFWEVAAEKGLSTAVVNWWATWPAAGPSTVLSERALLRLEQAGALDAEIWPGGLYSALRSDWPKLSYQARALALQAFKSVEREALRSVLLRSAELDATVILLAAHPALGARDLLAVYLPGLDIAQHALARTESPPTASALNDRAEAVRAYYRFLEQLIGRVVHGDRTVLVLVTHPGRVSSAAPGGIAVSGLVASASAPRIQAAFVDVAPTALYALGLPASRDLPGRPLTGLFNDAFVKRVPMRTVETYGRRSPVPPVRGGRPLDEEMIERLRSLGYIR